MEQRGWLLLALALLLAIPVSGTGEVFLEVLGPQGQGLELGCRSQGWFPKPTVQWVTEDGQGLSADTEIHQDSRKLSSVQSRVTVTGEQVGKVTCQILNPLGQVEKKTTVRISGAAFPRESRFVPAFWTLFLLFLLTLVAGAVLIFRGRNNQISWFSHRGKRQHYSDAEMDFFLSSLQMRRDPLDFVKSRSPTLLRTRGRTIKSSTAEDVVYMLQKNLQQISQQIETLQEDFQDMQESSQGYLEFLLRELNKEPELSRVQSYKGLTKRLFSKGAQEANVTVSLEQNSTEDLEDNTTEDLKSTSPGRKELSRVQSYKEFVTLDADTAHPRLEVSTDGRRVKDTGATSDVPSNEKRFDSHLFVLAKEGYTHERHYWEVLVGPRSSWALGIALESVTRKGPLTLSPKNGFWAIGLADGRDYGAYMDRWTPLSVSGKLQFTGIFLDIPAKQVTFYDALKGAALHTFSIADGSSQKGKFIPFFSMGPATAEPDPEPLVIVG